MEQARGYFRANLFKSGIRFNASFFGFTVFQDVGRLFLSRQELDNPFTTCKNGKEQPALNVLCSTFSKILHHSQNIKIIIDALNE
ncbi:Ankyrin repeat protein [Penicillium malachiteum]|nr:Ankyrin repeat protein [Penicillium malachiteum]